MDMSAHIDTGTVGARSVTTDHGTISLALTTLQPQAPMSDPVMNAVERAWEVRCSKLGGDARTNSGLHPCKNLPTYDRKIEDAFQSHKDQSYIPGILECFEPLFNFVELTRRSLVLFVNP
jgi:hypothetical protein